MYTQVHVILIYSISVIHCCDGPVLCSTVVDICIGLCHPPIVPCMWNSMKVFTHTHERERAEIDGSIISFFISTFGLILCSPENHPAQERHSSHHVLVLPGALLPQVLHLQSQDQREDSPTFLLLTTFTSHTSPSSPTPHSSFPTPQPPNPSPFNTLTL